MGDLVSPRLALLCRAAEALEGLEEEGLDVVGLQPAGFGAFHLLPDAMDLARVHRRHAPARALRASLEAGLRSKALSTACVSLRADFGPLAVADSLDQQLSKRPAFELELAEDVKDLSAQRLARLLQFFQQLAVNVALAGFLGDEVPEMADFGLADAVDAAEALLDAVRIPRQVVVHHQMGALKVDAFAGGIGRE